MNSVLFVIPGLKTGGTNSSLSSIYNCVRKQFDIKVFSIAHQPTILGYSFDSVIMKQNLLLSLFFSDYADQRGILKALAFFVKCIQSFFRLFGLNIGLLYGKRVVKKLESDNDFDCIVAFQEGYTTHFVSMFHNPNKYAWIHCNYNTYLPVNLSEESLYNSFSKIVCVSKYTASLFAERYPSLKDKILAIYNFLDLQKIQSLSQQPISDDRFLTNKPVIISVGRFSKVKRFTEIPRIAASLVEKGLKFYWYVIGPEEDSSVVHLFKKNLSQYRMQDSVIWLGGKTNPYPFFRSADVYVCLSHSEACPMVFKEAMFFNLPIVTTDFPSAFEFINNSNGIIAPFEDIDNAIIQIIHKKGPKTTNNINQYEDLEAVSTIIELLSNL